jgi:hypothetical protein
VLRQRALERKRPKVYVRHAIATPAMRRLAMTLIRAPRDRHTGHAAGSR